MKKIILALAIVLSGMLLYAQKSVVVKKNIDEFTGSVSYKTSPSRNLDYKANGKLGASVILFEDEETQQSKYYLYLSSSYYGGLGCTGIDRGKAYLKFDDETVLELHDMSKLDCAANFVMYFCISKEEYDIISTKSLVKVRVLGTERSKDIKIRNTEQLKLIFNTLPFE
jgi:hypothetical protein